MHPPSRMAIGTGLEKGREDGDDNDRYDADRHSWYRSATRGYETNTGLAPTIRLGIGEGFEAGYAEGYPRLHERW